MTLTSLLNTGRSTILAHQTALNVAANNTANAGTEGYAKRDIRFGSVGPFSGVAITSVQRRTEQFLGGRILAERSKVGAEEAKTSSLRALELHFTEGAASVGEQLDAFFNAVRTLESSPTDLQLRRDVLSKAEALALSFSNTANRMQEERRQVDYSLDAMVGRVNELTREIAKLNEQILGLESTGQEASDLRDRRDVAVTELADLVPVTAFEGLNGNVTVLLGGGNALVQANQASTLRAEEDVAYGGLRRIDLVDPGGTTMDITARLRSGKIGGTLELRDDELPTLNQQLDQLAFDFVNAVNGVHFAGYGMDGATGRDLFNPVPVADAAANVTLIPGIADNPDWLAASTTVAEANGGNDNLLALSNLADVQLAGGGLRTFGEEVAEMVGVMGRTVQANLGGLERATLQLEQLQTMKESQTGVSLDEEMIDITRFQRAYQAGARIVTTVDEMYQTILTM